MTLRVSRACCDKWAFFPLHLLTIYSQFKNMKRRTCPHHPPLGSTTHQMKLSSSRLRLQMKFTFSWKCYCNRNEIMQTGKPTHLHSERSRFVNVWQLLLSWPWQRVKQAETQWDLHESASCIYLQLGGKDSTFLLRLLRFHFCFWWKINNSLQSRKTKKRRQRDTKCISNDKYSIL